MYLGVARIIARRFEFGECWIRDLELKIGIHWARFRT